MSKIVHLAAKRGFCSGVVRALDAVERALKEGPLPVYVLHEIVHNEHVVAHWKARGVRFVNEPEEAEGGTLIFSAHGVSRAIEERAAALGVRLIDATCPIVKGLHRKAEMFAAEGRKILLFGKKGHREIEGVVGRVDSEVTVIESKEALLSYLAVLPEEEKKNGLFACLSQTTLNADDVAEMRALLASSLRHLAVDAEVCFATRDRQNAVRLLAQQCEFVIIVGSPGSSNSKRLCETASAAGARAILLSDPEEFDCSLLDGVSTVGVSSGASAPEELVRKLLGILKQYGFETVPGEC